jgi:hypothetical protein
VKQIIVLAIATTLLFSCAKKPNLAGKWWVIKCVENPADTSIKIKGTTFTKIFLNTNGTYIDSNINTYTYCNATQPPTILFFPIGTINSSPSNWTLKNNVLDLGIHGKLNILNWTSTTFRAQVNNADIFNFEAQ